MQLPTKQILMLLLNCGLVCGVVVGITAGQNNALPGNNQQHQQPAKPPLYKINFKIQEKSQQFANAHELVLR